MDGRGGCCMVRYAGDAAVASQVQRIMLRFRPIAPKPPSPRAGSPSAGSSGGDSGEMAARGEVGRRRRRRDGGGGGGGGGGRRRNRRAHPDERVAKRKVIAPEDPVTLQLMPETPERKEPPAAAVAPAGCPQLPDLAPSHLPPCEVTDARCVAAAGRRCTWAEARRALEGDACPALLSDASDRVAWTNAAYRRMVGSSSGEAVELATGGGFSCRLRVGEKGCLTVPCDVWRLAEDGWLAWRLDVTAALSLGR